MKKYAAASMTLGAMTLWASENFFWTAPPEGFNAAGLLLTWAAYSLCAAASLSVVLLTGVQGWIAVFLGGAVLGWLVEGVIVGTMYAAFPFQVVWTPLAWHALITGLAVVGVGRAAAGWPLVRVWLAWLGLGVFGGVFALFWPSERAVLPGLDVLLVYLFGLGLVVPLGNLILDRMGSLARPRIRWLLAAPILLAVLWLARVGFAFSPVYAVLPLVLGLNWWVMRRLGQPGLDLNLGRRPESPWRHAVFLVAPATTAVLASVGWAHLPQGWEGNAVALVLTGPTSIALLGWLIWRAARRCKGARSPRRTRSYRWRRRSFNVAVSAPDSGDHSCGSMA